MKTLLILRHAKSSWKQTSLPDHERPLAKRGKREAPEMGRLIRANDLTPDLILSSTARRARKTAEMVADECGYEGDIQDVPDFYPGEPEDYLRVLGDLPNSVQSVMVVGHNPGLEELLEALTGQAETLTTAALAQVEMPLESWQELSGLKRGKLVSLWRPSSET